MKNLQKHLQACTSKFESRPILTGIHFKNNEMIACDSNRLLAIRSEKSVNEPFTLNLKYMTILDGTYPDTSRLIPNNPAFTFINDFNKAILPSFKALKETIVEVSITDNILTILSKETNLTLLTLQVKTISDYETQYFNAKYIHDLLAFLIDNNNGAEITVHFTGSIRPLFFKYQNFDYLITPIRMK